MLDIPIFKAEADIEGLANKIRANRSISYVTQLKPADPKKHQKVIDGIVASSASSLTIQDLYPTESLLASTICNLNDDMFPQWDTYQARSTPVNKPDNLDHNEERIVGHMVRSWIIDDAGEVLDESSIDTVEDLPDLFHVCNASVIYTNWSKDELQEQVDTLIEEIEAGKKYVSMECLFAMFDYAMIDSDNKLEVITRNATTAFLTKHLRVYGGSGVYNDKRVCRYLRNFVFSGKGYVDEPANPDSIIFSKGSVKSVNFKTAVYETSLKDSAGVYLNNEQLVAANLEKSQEETNNMSSEIELLKSQLSETKEALQAVSDAKTELEKKVTSAGIAQYETKIDTLEVAVKTAGEKAQADSEQVAQLSEKITQLEAKIEELTKANAGLTQEVADVEAQKVRASRISTLVDGDIDKSEAESKVETFSNLTDEQFEVLATELINAAKKPSEDDEKTKKAKKDKEAKAAESVISDKETDKNDSNASTDTLENVETDDVEGAGAAAVDTEADELVETRQALAAFVSHRLGKKMKSADSSEE